ncbi:MAG: hypothetical protein EON48_02140 [Acetobacteraceae bacterium]|nr:MAG: hypothetical protein EON48_02140 [Acetobacteraceae bacterium]
MGSVTTTFEPGPGNTIRFRTRFEDDDRMVGHSQSDMEPQAEVFGIAWAEFIAASYGIVEQSEDQPAVIRPPAWAGVLIEALNGLRDDLKGSRDKMQEQFGFLKTQLENFETDFNRVANKMEKTADELDQVNAAMDRVIARMAGRAPDGRGE